VSSFQILIHYSQKKFSDASIERQNVQPLCGQRTHKQHVDLDIAALRSEPLQGLPAVDQLQGPRAAGVAERVHVPGSKAAHKSSDIRAHRAYSASLMPACVKLRAT
jgi:hypothetical protein